MGDVTEEELVQIATNFLLNAPPGEFMEVVTDVRALLPNPQLLNNTAAETFREYNTEQMVQVNSPNNKHQVLVTKHGEVADGEYLDPRGNQVISYDHIKQEVTGARPIDGELDSDVEPYRAAFDDEAVKYISEHYPHGATTVYGKKQGNQYKIVVAISSSKFNPNNFWNGRWRSTWQVTFGAGGGQATIDGKLQVNVHYYEDGNVQLNTSTDKHLQAPAGDPSATASTVIKAIIKAEQAFHASLDTSYTTMGDTTFKALRRALPITRTKIDWNKIRTYKLGNEMSQK
jgi:capping protein alpha